MTRNRVDGAPTVALLAMLLLALLALAERAGLPLPYVRAFLVTAALLAYAALVSLARTSRERVFIGTDGWRGPVQAGLAVAAGFWLMAEAVAPITSPLAWVGAMAGAPLGILAAHAVERVSASGGRDDDAEPTGWPGYLAAVSTATVGIVVLAAGLGATEREFARMLGLGGGLSLALAATLLLLPTLLGGARGALSLAGTSATAAAVILLGLIFIGIVWLGALPLPGQSEMRMLQAVAEARDRWGIGAPVHLLVWPTASSLLAQEALTAFGFAFAAAAALALSSAPAVPMRRRTTAATAALALALLPPLTTAIAGYAIEAAGTRFVGASAARPPVTLVESSTLGLVRVCGEQPKTAEGLRTACKAAPRDPSTLDWSRIELTPAFLRSGLSAALGFPSTISLAVDGLRLAMAMAAGALGLWIAARAIGRGLLGRSRQAAGLASLRQGLIRVAALAVALAVAALLASNLTPPAEAAYAVAAAASVLSAAKLWCAARRPAPKAEGAVATAPRRRGQRASAQSETA